ncbi:MAG: PEP-CTERM sorting domain-containing protein [Alphaproteobacteria bacterium]
MSRMMYLGLFAALVVLAVSGLSHDAFAQTALDGAVDRVPEPGSMALLVTGIGALLFGIWRRNRD